MDLKPYVQRADQAEKEIEELSKTIKALLTENPKINNQEVKDEMVKEFVNYYGNNIVNESTLINGVKEFLKWCKEKNISMAVCTNKQEHLAIDLLKKIGINDYFEYVAGHNTFDYCKPDPRHLTNVIEILGGDLKKSLMKVDTQAST